MNAATEKQQAERIDIDGYRDRIAPAVGIGVGDLTTRRGDPRGEMRRMVAAYVLLHQDKLPLDNIAQIMAENESWARAATDYVERRIGHYHAFELYVDRALETYTRACIEAGKVSNVGVDGIRQRIAGRVGMKVTELVSLERDNDQEIVQRVAAYLLLSQDGLSAGKVAEVMCKGERWVLSAKHYVERHVNREQGLKDFVAKTSATYADEKNIDGIGGSKSLAVAKR